MPRVDSRPPVCEVARSMLSARAYPWLLVVAIAGIDGVAFAQPAGGQGEMPALPSPSQDEPGVVHPAAPDERTGHVYIRAGADLEIPVGQLRSGVSANDVVGLGLGIDASIGVGLSRHAELDVAGTYALMQSDSRCTSCSGDHAALNLGFTYHLGQGIALDPWMRLGAGYRTADYENGTGGPVSLVSGRFHGIDFADISLGGTFFPTPGFGFGPFAAANVGTYVSRPAAADGTSGSPRVYAFFQVGLQLALDPARWIAKRPAKPAKTASSDQPNAY